MPNKLQFGNIQIFLNLLFTNSSLNKSLLTRFNIYQLYVLLKAYIKLREFLLAASLKMKMAYAFGRARKPQESVSMLLMMINEIPT